MFTRDAKRSLNGRDRRELQIVQDEKVKALLKYFLTKSKYFSIIKYMMICIFLMFVLLSSEFWSRGLRSSQYGNNLIGMTATTKLNAFETQFYVKKYEFWDIS